MPKSTATSMQHYFTLGKSEGDRKLSHQGIFNQLFIHLEMQTGSILLNAKVTTAKQNP